MAKAVYKCNTCNLEHEIQYLHLIPAPNTHPCPKCGVEAFYLEQEQYIEQTYVCEWGGCAEKLTKEYKVGIPVEDTVPCKCGRKMVKKLTMNVAYGNSSSAPIDVVIGRDAERRWSGINERQEQRNKIRRESGEFGLKATSVNEYKPIEGGRLESVEIPQNMVNVSTDN